MDRLPFNNSIHQNSDLCIVSSSFSTLCCVVMLISYVRRHDVLQCSFNDLAAAACALQLLHSLARIIFAATSITLQGPPVWLCDVSGTLELFFSCSTQLVMIGFFLSLTNIRRYSHSTKILKICVSVSLSVATLAVVVAWIILTQDVNAQIDDFSTNIPRSEVHFVQQLGWCWIPTKKNNHLEVSTLMMLYFTCSYFFSVLFVILAVVSFLLLVVPQLHSLNSFVLFRFIGVAAIPGAFYVLEAICRLLNATSNAEDYLSAAVSFCVPLIGAIDSITFLVTEGLIHMWICRREAMNGFASVVRSAASDVVKGTSQQRNREEEATTDMLLGSQSRFLEVVKDGTPRGGSISGGGGSPNGSMGNFHVASSPPPNNAARVSIDRIMQSSSSRGETTSSSFTPEVTLERHERKAPKGTRSSGLGNNSTTQYGGFQS